MKKITTPLTMDIIEDLEAGDEVYISGKIYTMRDAAHQKIYDMIQKKEKLPFDLKNQVIYYCGPTPAKDGNVIGACGPTTSSRMDKYTPLLLKNGLKGMIGKGERSVEVKDAIKKYKAVYFAALGGLGALYADNVKNAKVIAFPELGPEAVYEMDVEDFYAIVINDAHGNDYYVMNRYN
ncbi:MAG: fumarate hydratase C-terminal domain-containing protein [Candidatus Goldbacteria bacterium]|nr:fumarate hydratase C-terminal domain-containing protein [Candidatus Goldiibacteriota bacterium]